MREHAHELVDRLGPEQLAAVVRLLEKVLDDKVLDDDDEWSKHDVPIPTDRAIAEFWEKLRREG